MEISRQEACFRNDCLVSLLRELHLRHEFLEAGGGVDGIEAGIIPLLSQYAVGISAPAGRCIRASQARQKERAVI